jgi:hypothetical protein
MEIDKTGSFKGPTFIKPSGFVGVRKNLESDHLDVNVQSMPVTPPEQAFLERRAR